MISVSVDNLKVRLRGYWQVAKILIQMLHGDIRSPGKRKSVRELLWHGEFAILSCKLKSRWKQAWHLSFFYAEWIRKNEQYDPDQVRGELKEFKYRPLISIVMPVYNVKLKFLREAIDSVRNNYYPDWELCICDDASPAPAIRGYLREMMRQDARIKCVFRESNGHISRASNDALQLATGEFVGLLDHDDTLAPFCFFEVIKTLNRQPELDFIYSNEDITSAGGIRAWPVFKPTFAPHTFLSSNYLCHFVIIRKTLLDRIGGFRPGFEGSQDYDLFLRCLEHTRRIFHLRKVLYHWRMIPGSTAQGHAGKPYAYEAGLRAVREHVKRSGRKAAMFAIKEVPHYRCVFNVAAEDMVTIIIPGRDQPTAMKKCLDSIYRHPYQVRFEVIFIDNGSVEPDIEAIITDYRSRYDNFSVLPIPLDFNYSMLNNRAAVTARGNILLFLNNDTEVISPDWLDLMTGYARQPETGAVGARLLYPNGRIQHAGIYFAPGTVGKHLFCGCPEAHDGYFSNMHYQFNVSAVTGACLMVERNKFMAAGGFDEELKITCNDIDLCLKLRQHGWHNVMLPFVKLYHHEALSRGYDNDRVKVRRFEQETARLQQRWGDKLSEDYYYLGVMR